MSNFYKKAFASLVFASVVSFGVLSSAQAQCPAGSVAPQNNRNYTNGEVVCISNTFSGSIQLNNGARMVIVDGGQFTGTVVVNNGSEVEVFRGGVLRPSGMWNFRGRLRNFGTAVLNNTSFQSGTEIINDGSITANSLNSFNGVFTFTNNVCGEVTTSGDFNINHSGTVFTNRGRINALSAFQSAAGTRIVNSGRLYISTNSAINGAVFNEGWMVYKNGVSINPSTTDSVVNTHYFVVNGNMPLNKPLRNEGLVMVSGTVNANAGGIFQNEASALFRIGGDFTRNTPITSGGNLHVTGITYNQNLINGRSAANRLTVNKNLQNMGSFVTINANMPLFDTTNFVSAQGRPLSCNIGGGPLPVKLVSFEAAERNRLVTLNWITSAEIDHDYFEVEHSTDGRNYVAVGRVKNGVQSNNLKNYTFAHAQPGNGQNFYRLKIVSTFGLVEYSQVIRLNLQSLNGASVRTYPNPFTDKVLIDVNMTQNAPVAITVSQTNGAPVKSINKNLTAGKHTLQIDQLSSLPAGMYFITVVSGAERATFKVVK